MVVRYDRGHEEDAAEVAFVVEDGQQRRGLATVMLEHLAAVARSNGIERFFAETLPDNRAMMDVFRHAGFAVTSKFDSGVINVSFPLAPSADLDQHIDDREQVVSRGVDSAHPQPDIDCRDRRQPHARHDRLRARSQPRPRRIHGGRASGESRRRICRGIHAYATVAEAPGPPDLAIIAVPADAVAEVVEQCGAAHVGGIVIISAGFAELGTAGRAAEASLVETARRHGMRVVGPNCMGLANTNPSIRMNAIFAPVDPIPGNVAFMTQSGALGISLIDESARGASASRASCRSATRPTSRATTCCDTGKPTRRRP